MPLGAAAGGLGPGPRCAAPSPEREAPAPVGATPGLKKGPEVSREHFPATAPDPRRAGAGGGPSGPVSLCPCGCWCPAIGNLPPGPVKASVLPLGNDVRGAERCERLCPWAHVVCLLSAASAAGVKLAEAALLCRERGCT